MPMCVIMRGIPGSGKSTWAKASFPDATRCSADEFFMAPAPRPPDAEPGAGAATHEYRFDVGRIGEAHAWCFRGLLKALADRVNTVVVDNTHVRLWEFENAILAARLAKYNIRVVEVRPPGRQAVGPLCALRCSHGVPYAKVLQMERDFEPYPGAEVVPPRFTLQDVEHCRALAEKVFPWWPFSAQSILESLPHELRG